MIKHVSFDVWNTLISSNPQYALERAKFLSFHIGINADEIKRTYAELKQGIDRHAEATGRAMSIENNISMLLITLNAPRCDPTPIYYGFKRLFALHPPIVDAETIEAVRRLRENNITVSIASNTNFIAGKWMYEFLKETFGPFLFQLYSDELLVSKPNNTFFRWVEQSTFESRNLPKEQIAHVGDNHICDVNGASRYGFTALRVRGPQDVPSIVEGIINGIH